MPYCPALLDPGRWCAPDDLCAVSVLGKAQCDSCFGAEYGAAELMVQDTRTEMERARTIAAQADVVTTPLRALCRSHTLCTFGDVATTFSNVSSTVPHKADVCGRRRERRYPRRLDGEARRKTKKEAQRGARMKCRPLVSLPQRHGVSLSPSLFSI